MDTLHKRIALFLIACMGVRLLLVYVAKNVSATWLRYMGYLFVKRNITRENPENFTGKSIRQGR